MVDTPIFDRATLTFSARRVLRGIELSARFIAPQLSTGTPAQYLAGMTIDPQTRGIKGLTFSYSRDGSKYLALHGSGTDKLRQLAYQIRDRFLASPAWPALKERGPDPDYSVDHLGRVKIRERKPIDASVFGREDD
jgi:hypothetical protein